MDVHNNQQDLLLNVSENVVNKEEFTEETPLTNIETNEEDLIPFMIPETYDWNTSFISQICREGDIYRLRLFIEFSRQTLTCAVLASQLVDRLDVDTGLSPLHHAARHQQLHICLMLLSNIKLVLGVNIKDENGRTPIHAAFRLSKHISNISHESIFGNDFGQEFQDCASWHEEYNNNILTSDHPLIYLFARTAGDVNVRDKYLLTPLHYAVVRQNLNGVKQLIALKADIESCDRQGIRPLHLACKEGYLSIVEYLIEQNATIDAFDADLWTPLHHACVKGHANIVELIYSKFSSTFEKLIMMKTNNNATCIHLAVESGNILLVKNILKKYDSIYWQLLINEQAEPFGTPLHIAAKICDSSMVRLLYQYGADPSILNAKKQSPLHIACALNHFSIIQEFYNLTKTSLLEIKDQRGRTALSVTTHPDIIDQLITFGADISSIDHDHMNAIMIAVSNNQLDVAIRLLSAIDKNKSLDILDRIEKQDQRSIFLIAIRTGSIDMCSLLLTHSCVSWDTIDKHRMNAFHIAAQYNHFELIKFLCNHIKQTTKFQSMNSRSSSIATTIEPNQANVIKQVSSNIHLYIDAQDEDGKTPLHIASENGHLSSIQVLLDNGADVLLATYLGQLPLHVAIQHGHVECANLLIKCCTKNMNQFQLILSRRQLPIITACQYGFVNIVNMLLSQNIGIDYDSNLIHNQEENSLEIAIKYRQTQTVHTLLEYSRREQLLMSIRDTHDNIHQTPLRDLIRYMPNCAQHAFDKFIEERNVVDVFGNTYQKVTYNYQYIDDYFMIDHTLYSTRSRQLYRNHPFIIALDCEHHFLLEHPLSQQLMSRKWKLYWSFFYFARILSFLILLISTCYVLIKPAPFVKSLPSSSIEIPSIPTLVIRWVILLLSIINLLKMFLEICLFRGVRVLFAQLFELISFLVTLVAFIPYEIQINNINQWRWQLTASSILMQWFNIAVMLRSVPMFGNFFIMIQSILMKFLLLLSVTCPLLIAFTISIQMIFFDQPAFINLVTAVHKSSSMTIGEFDYEALFFSKSTFKVAAFIFIPFIVIMTIVFMNLLLGITIGDINGAMKNARAKANAYWIRELIYIESTLPSKTWLKHNIVEFESVDLYANNSIANKIQEKDEYENESLINQSPAVELERLVQILDMLITQAKQILDYEINLEQILKNLLSIANAQDSIGLFPSRSSISK